MKISSHPELIEDSLVKAINAELADSEVKHHELATLMGMSRGGFSKLLRRPSDVRERLPEIAKHLKTTPEKLLHRAETHVSSNGRVATAAGAGTNGHSKGTKERPAMSMSEEDLSNFDWGPGYRSVPIADEYRAQFSSALYAVVLPAGHAPKDGDLVAWQAAEGGYKLKWFNRDRRMGILVLTSRDPLFGPECFAEKESGIFSVVIGFMISLPPKKPKSSAH